MGHAFINAIAQNTTASNNDTWFRTWVGLSNSLTSLGIPKTSDTGQVDWTTVTLPAVDVFTAYEIRRLNDTEQSTDPVFMKLAFAYSNVSTFSQPRIRITLGTGSDGAGNLTGVSQFVLNNICAQSSSAHTWTVSTDDHGFAVLAGFGPTGMARPFFSIERARDVDGAIMPGVLITTSSTQTASTSASYVSAISSVVDLVKDVTYSSNTISASYWKALSVKDTTLSSWSAAYPFGELVMPSYQGAAFSNLWLGAARADFPDAAVVNVPRWTTATTTKYYMDQRELDTFAGAFGTNPSGATTAVAQTPAGFGMPLIYWS